MNFEAARIKMVDNQIRTTDVTSHPVLAAFLSVPREEFVPAALKPLAYIDSDIELAANGAGGRRYLMEPSPLAKLLQLAEISKDDTVSKSAAAPVTLRRSCRNCRRPSWRLRATKPLRRRRRPLLAGLVMRMSRW